MVQLKIPEKLYVRLYAGMGDFYKRYFCHPTWQCLEDLKNKHPNISIHALLVSQTIPALELIDNHPYIDKIIRPMIHLREFKNEDITKYVGNHRLLTQPMANNFEQNIPPIYLSKEDEDFLQKITSQHKKFICLHPFAGDKHGMNTRTPLLVNEYIPIIDSLVNKGYSVMLMGKTWERIHLGSKGTYIIKESAPPNRPGLVNLINKTNVRTGAELIRRSNGFVGTASSMMCAAWSMGGIRTTIITARRWQKPLVEMPWTQDKIANPNHQMIYLDNNRSPQKLKEIANVTAKWF